MTEATEIKEEITLSKGAQTILDSVEKLTVLELSELVNAFSKLDSNANQPVVGKNAFTHKSGLHVKAVMKEPESYEAISPESVHRKRHFVIDKYTGNSALNNKLFHMGISVTPKELDTILIEIKSHPEKLNWDAEDLISLINSMGIKS